MGELIFLVFAPLFVGALFAERRKQVKKVREITQNFNPPPIYGETNGFADDKSCQAAGLFGGKGIRLGFSKESGKELMFDQDSHLTIVGPTGSAKTAGFMMPNIMGTPGVSKLLVDIKGSELTQVAGEYLASRGPYYALAPYGLGGRIPRGVKIARYNPMAPLFDGKTPAVFHESIARRNSDGCVGGEAIGRDSFFVNGARRVFTICQLAVAKYGKPVDRNLPAVARMIEQDFEGLCELIIATKDPELGPIFTGYLKEMSGENHAFRDILLTIIVETAFLRDPAIAYTLSGSDYRFEWLGEKEMTVAICMPLDMVEVNGKLSRLIVACALGELLRPERSRKRKIVMFCDECYQYGTMDPLINAYATARAFGVRLWTVWSDIGQMEERYPKTYMSILANSGAQIFLGSRDPQSSKFMSEQSGFRDVLSRSRSVNWNLGGWPTVTDGTSQMRREVLMVNEAQNLPKDEALIWVRGVKGVIRATHKRYFEQFRFWFRYKKNPLYSR